MDHYLLDDIAKAVADDSAYTHPRNWLSRHEIPVVLFAGVTKDDRAKYGILIEDYNQMVKAAQFMVKLVAPKPDNSAVHAAKFSNVGGLTTWLH